MNHRHEFDPRAPFEIETGIDQDYSRRRFLSVGAAAAAVALSPAAMSQALRSDSRDMTRFQPVPAQFIAALGAPDATSGNNAHEWGLWRLDPGPRGVRVDRFEQLQANGGIAPARWRFDNNDWWLEEHGLIMEQPEFPIAPGQYMVTGNRATKSVLTVHAPSADGAQRWELDGGATIYDVTHLRCRSARYTPAAGGGSCTPTRTPIQEFPVAPGAEMPPIAGCDKQDYAVLIVIGLPVRSA